MLSIFAEILNEIRSYETDLRLGSLLFVIDFVPFKNSIVKKIGAIKNHLAIKTPYKSY
jgi:hypothetical protein